MKDTDAGMGMGDLLELISTLRSEKGCPWDQKQTPQSMKKYLLEECDELVDAIDLGDPAAVREECGDVLFILTFLIRLYEEQGLFDLQAVCAEVHAKMVRRHPHVFGGPAVGSEEELHRQWEAIKEKEKRNRADKLE